MNCLGNIWRKLTPTKALVLSSGDLETMFFEPVYRTAYFSGLSSRDRDLPYLLYSSTIKLMSILFVSGEVWFACSENLSLDEIASSINVIVIHFLTMLRLKNMMDHKHIYKKLATSMESTKMDISTPKRKQLVEFWARRHKIYLKLLLALGHCALAAWHIYPLIDELDYNLMVGVRIPYKYDTPLKYTFTYIVVAIAFVFTSLFVMVTDLIMQAHLLSLICQFTILADCFENILVDCRNEINGDSRVLPTANNNCFVKVYLRRLNYLVHHHKFVLDHSMELRSILSTPMLWQLAASGILICFVGYQLATTLAENLAKCLMSLFYLSYNMFALYIICRWCEEITIQSQNIGSAIYSSGWEAGMVTIPGLRSTILFVILRANKPIVFSAGGMYNLSLTSYTSLVKASYSALTFLLRFR
uniref:Odorant receptor n=1 Tax=Dendrolimus kikuchii TaxID=765133 RepID=A0A076E9D0_9NEOP|nr:odorant receptor [Dendrolimus kikuchii]